MSATKSLMRQKAFKGKVGTVLHEFKQGTLNIGKSKKTVKNRKQAIAIALNVARKKVLGG